MRRPLIAFKYRQRMYARTCNVQRMYVWWTGERTVRAERKQRETCNKKNNGIRMKSTRSFCVFPMEESRTMATVNGPPDAIDDDSTIFSSGRDFIE